MFSHSWSYCNTLVFPTGISSNVRVFRSMPVFFYRDHISTLLQHICVKSSAEIFLKAWVHLHLLRISAFIVNTIFKMYNHFCIPDWLPKGKVQVSDCNFDPAPPEILATICNQKNAIFEAFIKPSAGFTQDIPNVQPSLDWIGTDWPSQRVSGLEITYGTGTGC